MNTRSRILDMPFVSFYRCGATCPKNHQDAIARETIHKLAHNHCWSVVLRMLDWRPSLLDTFCSKYDSTLAMKAAEQGKLYILESLNSRGANLNLKNAASLNVFDYALRHDEVFTIAKMVSWLKGNTHYSFRDPMFYQDALKHPATLAFSNT